MEHTAITTLADDITAFVRARITDQNIAVQALENALQQCRSGAPWTQQAGHAGGGGATA